MKLALAFLLAFIGTWALALRGTASVERLAGLGLGRHFVERRRRKHAGAAGLTRAGTGTTGCAGTRAKRTALRAARTTRSGGTRRVRPTLTTLAALLRTHRIAKIVDDDA